MLYGNLGDDFFNYTLFKDAFVLLVPSLPRFFVFVIVLFFVTLIVRELYLQVDLGRLIFFLTRKFENFLLKHTPEKTFVEVQEGSSRSIEKRDCF